MIFPPIQQFIDLVKLRQRPGMVVAEIGVWDGTTSAKWIPIVHSNGGTAILVDNFLGNPTAVGPHAVSKLRREDVFSILKERINNYSCVRIIEGDSAESARQVDNLSLDVCFIDADHSYSHVRSDIEAWKPKVISGGILCGHDYDGNDYDERYVEMDFCEGKHHGVIKTVQESFPEVKILADSCWMVEL